MGVINLSSLKVEKRQTAKPKKGRVISMREVHDTWEFFEDVGWIDGNTKIPRDYSRLTNSLKNIPLAIIGSSPAAKGVDFSLLRKIKTMVVNHVIEVYPNADMLIFQDMRFLRATNYDLRQYKGYIFTSNTNPYGRKENKKNVCYFKPIHRGCNPSTEINRGVYTRKSTGVCALNISLILGCNPIYMVGMDNSKSYYKKYTEGQDTHLVTNYHGPNTKQALDAYIHTNNVLYKAFSLYSKRIINVCEDGFLDYFQKISVENFNSILERM
jgi:hypothetical protein